MGKYRFLMDIKIKGKRFKVLENEFHKKYFLRILDDNSLLYPTIEEYIELDRIYNIKVSNRISASSRGVEIAAKVIDVATKKLLPLAAIASITMTGCTTEAVYTDDTAEEIDLVETAKSVGMDLAQTKSGMYYVTKMDNGDGTNTIFVSNNDEFRKYVDVKHPTFDDVRKALAEKENIPKRYKDYINQHINNLEETHKNLDLAVMYYNIERLIIEEKEEEDIKNDVGASEVVAYFNAETGNMVVPKTEWNELLEYEISHETDHMLTEAVLTDQNGDKVVRSLATNVVSYMLEDDDTINFEIYQLGNAHKEAATEIVTENSTQMTAISCYNELQDELKLFQKTINKLDIYSILNNDVTYLSDKMYDNKVEDFDNLLSLQDEYYWSAINDIEMEEGYIETIYELYLPDLYADKIRDGESAEKIYREFINGTQGIVEDFREYKDSVETARKNAFEDINSVLDEEGEETKSWEEVNDDER